MFRCRHWMVVAVLGICFLASNLMSQQQAPEIPDTPSGRLLAAFITALNSGDEELWKGFIQDHWKEREGAFEDRVGMMRMVHDDVGGLELYRIDKSEEYTVSALFKAKNPNSQFEWIDLTLMADTLPPHKMDRISLRPGEQPGFEVPEGEMTEREMIDFLDDYLDNLIVEDKFSGTILIANNGEPIYTRVAGQACKRYDVPNRLDTKFNLGSMNKMFTGVAIMQLVEQGKLSVDDKVGKYLPDIPRKEIAETVTIHQLLTHTSGMQDYWEEMFDAHWWEIKTVDQMADLIFDDTLLFEPGSEFHYSNSGPIVLGMIIEKVTGQDYFDYIRENIYEPAGMINSDCYDIDRPVPNLAIGYTKIDYEGRPDPEGKWRNNLFLHAAKGGPAGGGFSTVEDLMRFDIALRQNKLITKESFDLLTTGKVERRPGIKYAYLFMDKTVNGHRIVGHGGGAPGINANLDMYLDSGYTVAVMANYDAAAGMVANKIQELLTK